jgi:hypothetical protein
MVEVGTKSVAALSFAGAQSSPAAAPTPAPAPAPAPAAAQPAPEPAPAPAAAPEPTPAESMSSDVSADVDTGQKREPFFKWFKEHKLAWLGAGLAVAGVTTGVIFAFASKSNYDNADNIAEQIRDQKTRDGLNFAVCESPPTDEYRSACGKFTDAKDTGDSQRTLSIVSFVVAGVAAGGTIAYYFVSTKKKSQARRRQLEHTAVAPAVSPNALGVVVTGTF